MSLLRFRNDLNRAIRRYFEREAVLEVTTSLVRKSGASEVHLKNLRVFDEQGLEAGAGYLQTSPEYAMKCLLASYKTSIFQICPAFRGGETGHKHSTEFQMLEWYRYGFRLSELMDDLVGLLSFLGDELKLDYDLATISGFERVSYRQLFESRYAINPHQADRDMLMPLVEPAGVGHLDDDSTIADVLDALFSIGVEPAIKAPTIVYDYPACQAALAETRMTPDDDWVSNRFELYVNGIEIANAYQELTDADELRSRFKENNRLRRNLGRPEIPDDEDLITAVTDMKRCAGIALGIERLAMVLRGATSIDAVRP